jgi:hypothetical protein
MKDKSSMDFLKESMAQYRKDKKLDFDSALINLNKSLLEYKEILKQEDIQNERNDKLNDLGIDKLNTI